MKTRTIAIVAASWFLLALVQLLAALVNAAAAIVAAIVVGIALFGILRVLDLDLESAWSPIVIAAVSSLSGIVVRYVGNPATADWPLWLAPVIAAIAASLVVLARNSKSRRCGLCNRRMGKDLAFECPRCGMVVCDRNCWIFEHSRCRLCEENRVPIFPPDGRWWDRRLGPRMRQGRCQLCLAEAADADLRACARCGRPQCRPCWDSSNGQCSRCQWIVEDLPEQLQPYMIRDAGPDPAPRFRSR